MSCPQPQYLTSPWRLHLPPVQAPRRRQARPHRGVLRPDRPPLGQQEHHDTPSDQGGQEVVGLERVQAEGCQRGHLPCWKCLAPCRTNLRKPWLGQVWCFVTEGMSAHHITVARVDWVQVPADLPLGEYVISFRWDTMDMQVWVSCANLRIVA